MDKQNHKEYDEAMTLDEEFQKYKGQSLLVPGDTEADRGQCVQWVDYVLHEVYGLPYHYGNAIDWWYSPKELLTENFEKITDGSIKKGDLVVFNTNVGSQYGHIDVAIQDGTIDNFQGADSNWSGNKTVHLVQHTGRQYILGSLRLKGVDEMITKQILESMTGAYFGSMPDPADYNNWVGKNELSNMVMQFEVDQRRKNYFNAVQKGFACLNNPASTAQSKVDQIKKIVD